MTIKGQFKLAGAVALALGIAPLALAQYPSSAPSPNTAASPAYGTATAPQSSPAMMSSPMMTSGQAGTMKSSGPNLSKSQVRQIQQALEGLGYYIKVDGAWGQGTRDDIKDVQKKNGLNITGYPDENTMRALGLVGNQPAAGSDLSSHHSTTEITTPATTSSRAGTLSSPMMTSGQAGTMSSATMTSGQAGAMSGKVADLSSTQIKQIQQALDDQGYQVDADGTWNQDTYSALKEFQQDNGLPATGYPDKNTRQELGLDW